METILKYFIC